MWDKRAQIVKNQCQHQADLYNQDPEVWSAKTRNHRNVESVISHRSPHCDFGHEERACKVHESIERSWRGQGTSECPESGIIEYLPHRPFLSRLQEEGVILQ